MKHLSKSLKFSMLAALVCVCAPAFATDSDIVIASKTYNDSQFTTVRTALNTAITKVNGVVADTIDQAGDIGDLAMEKQTRPATNCANDKKCLLVKNPQQALAWYEIVDCSENAFFNSLETSYSAPGVTVDNVCSSSVSAITGCSVNDGEWVSSWDKGFVMGVSKSVSLMSAVPGTVITLANNVSSNSSWSTDQVCVCKVTGYNERDIQNDTYAGRTNFDAGNKWVVAGRTSGYGMQTDASCSSVCARYGVGGGGPTQVAQIKSYYSNLGNTCMGSASEGAMCYYNGFMDNIVHNGVAGARGWVSNEDSVTNGVSNGACASGGYFAGNNWCQASILKVGYWMTQFVTNDGNNTNLGYVVGFGGFATVPEGTTVNSVIDLSASDNLNWQPAAGNNAIVCVVERYKSDAMDGERGVRNITSPALARKAVVVRIDSNYSSYEYTHSGQHGGIPVYPAAEICSQYMSNVVSGASGQVYNWLMGDCPLNQ